MSALLVAACTSAAAETRPPYGGAAVGALLGEPSTYDPVEVRGHADAQVVALVFDTLYRVGPDGALIPHLAAAMPELVDGKVRIPVRPGVRFHDGTALTAADVAATLLRVRASASAGWLLVGVDELAADGDVVVMRVSPARKDLSRTLATPWTAITPRGAAPARDVPVGSGPFRVIARKRDRLELEAWDGHAAGRAYLDRVTVRWFTASTAEAQLYETGGSHWSLRGATRFVGATPKHVTAELESPATLLVYVGFGRGARRGHAEVLTDRDFRAALDLALARGGLTAVGTGERIVPTSGPVPLELGGPGLAVGADDPRLGLATAALVRSATRVPALGRDRLATLELEILAVDSRPDDREVAARVARALEKLGIASTVATVGAGELARRVAAGTCDLYIGQATAELSTASWLYAQAFALGGDRAAAEKILAGTLAGRRAAESFASRLPIVPLYHRAVRVHHRADLRGAWFDTAARLGIADLFGWTR